MRYRRLLSALLLAGMMFVLIASPVDADKEKQKRKSKEIPEVPIVAMLPLAAAAVGGGYYLIQRRRRSDAPVD